MSSTYQVFICVSHKPRVFGGGCCSDKGSESIIGQLKSLLEENQLLDKVEVNSSSCLKNCLNGPSLLVLPGRVTYGKVGEEELETIVKQHFIGGVPVKKLIKVPTSITG